MSSLIDHMRAFRKRIRANNERREFEEFMIATPCSSTTTEDEMYAKFLYQREIAQSEGYPLKWTEVDLEIDEKPKLQGSDTIFLAGFGKISYENFVKLVELKINICLSILSSTSQKYKQIKLLRDEMKVLQKNSVKYPLDDIDAEVANGNLSTKSLKNIQWGVSHMSVSEGDVHGALKNGNSEEQLPDNDAPQIQVCHNSIDLIVSALCAVHNLLQNPT